MQNKTKVLTAVGLAAFVGLVYWAVSTVPQVPEATEPGETVMTYNANTLSETKAGKTVWEMTADKIEVNADTKKATMENISAKFYTEDGRTIHLTAPRGTYDDDSRDVTLIDGVKADSSDGGTMSSQEAKWVSKTSTLQLTGKAKLDYPEQQVKASGDMLESSDGFSNFHGKGSAHIEKGNN